MATTPPDAESFTDVPPSTGAGVAPAIATEPSDSAGAAASALLDSAPAAPAAPLGLMLARHLLAVVIALAIGAGSLWLYTRGNDFPTRYYQPDEWGKAQQTMGMLSEDSSGKVTRGRSLNHNHPLLMLEGARLAVKWFHVPAEGNANEVDVAIAGRWTSATLASIGVAALALAGYASYGFIGLFLGGLTVALCPPLLLNAHFFKEDASLLGGVMVAILAARYTLSARTIWTQIPAAILLGLGCGAAASGKYVGVITVLPALVALFLGRLQIWFALPARIIVFLAVGLLTFHFINSRSFMSWKSFEFTPQARSGFEGELQHAEVGHYGVALKVPNTFWLRTTVAETMPHIWIFGAIGMAWLIVRARIGRWGIVLFTFIATFAAILTRNTIPMARYSLPVTVGVYFIAAMLVAHLLTDPCVRRRPTLRRAANAGFALCVAAVLIFQGSICREWDEAFVHDSRQQLHEWIALHTPADAVIAADNHAGLYTPGDPRRYPNQTPIRQRILQNTQHVANLEPTLDALVQKEGVSYVAVTDLNYSRFFDPEVGPLPGEEEWFEQHREFYTELFYRGELVWSSNPKHPSDGWANIDVRLYDISHLKPVKR